MKIILSKTTNNIICSRYIEPQIHPCGDCISYGDEYCMADMYDCEYSDKNIIEKLRNGGKIYVIRKI